MQTSSPDIDQLKSRMKATWMAGDFGQIANFTVQAAEEFVQRLGIAPGSKVLDVACGTGNTAIPAARTGADVVGVDIATNLLEQARQRATAENLSVRFQEGDPDLPEGLLDVLLRQPAEATQPVEDSGETTGQTVEHCVTTWDAASGNAKEY